jgi:FtsH-binding integral membrane protein
MENKPLDFNYTEQAESTVAKTFMTSVFSWMFLALTITGVVSYVFATNDQLLMLLFTETGLSPLGWIVMLAPLAFILVMNFGYERLSTGVMIFLLLLYSVCMGMSLSFIFLIYAHSTLISAFAITGGTFGVMAILGYTTKTDLSKLGPILMMGLVGIIIASIVNFFMNSSAFAFLIDCVCVVVFTLLTAFKVQNLKDIAAQGGGTSKLAVFGALSLYITFINLFMTILRIMGSRR